MAQHLGRRRLSMDVATYRLNKDLDKFANGANSVVGYLWTLGEIWLPKTQQMKGQINIFIILESQDRGIDFPTY